MAEAGQARRFEWRSYTELGLPFEPTLHDGPASPSTHAQGEQAPMMERNAEVRRQNTEVVFAEPGAVTTEVAKTRGVFLCSRS